MSIGNLVFNDLNNNGLKEAGENGIDGVGVQLLNGSTDAVITSATTSGGGLYSFGSLLPGTYKVRIPTPPLATPLASNVVAGDNGIDNDNNGSQPGILQTAVTTGVITLSSLSEPGTTGVTNNETTIDIGLRACPPISISPTTLPVGTVSSLYTTIITATGGEIGGYSWAKTAGTLPPGLGLSSASGTLSGTPTTAGLYSFTVTATDTKGCVGTAVIGIRICPIITIIPATLGSGFVGHAYNQATAFTASGGNGAYTWNVSNLPTGLTFNSTTRKIEGTATALGSWNVSVTATDVDGCSGTITPTLEILCPPITVTPASLVDAYIGSAYNQSVAFAASNGTAPYGYVATGLPPGMSWDSASRKIIGTPNTVGVFPVTVTATDSYGCQGVRMLNLRVCPIITITPTSLANAFVGSAYSQTTAFSAAGGASPYTYGASSLPPGMSFDAATRKVVGTPTTAGLYTVIVTATDANLCVGSISVPLRVCPIITISPATIPDANVGVVYTQGSAFTAAGGNGAYTWSLTGLPAGLTFNAGTRRIEGTAASLGLTEQTLPLTVTATDADGCPGSRVVNLKVIPAMAVGNLVWLDTDNDGTKDVGETGLPGITVQLWSAGSNGTRDNGAGDDVLRGTTTTDASGLYAFSNVIPGSGYYVRIPTLPRTALVASQTSVNTDNGIDNDNNGVQPGGINTPILSHLFTLAVGLEPASAVDGTDVNTESTIDIGLKPTHGDQVVFSEIKPFNPASGEDSPGAIHRWFSMRYASNGTAWPTATDATAVCVDPAQSYAPAGTGYNMLEVDQLPALITYYPATPAQRTMAMARIHWLVDNYWTTWVTGAAATSETWLYMREMMREIIMDAGTAFDLTVGNHQFAIPSLVALTSDVNAVASSYRSSTFIVCGADPDHAFRDQSLVFVTTNPLPSNLVFGSHVWNDYNDNGIADVGESGIPNVKVELYFNKDGNSANGNEWRVGYVDTDSLGRYCFNGLAPGLYEVVIPASKLPSRRSTCGSAMVK